MKDTFNLEKQMVFYRSYHFDTINVLIHSVFVPTILFSFTGILCSLKFDDSNPYFSVATILTVGYTIFYLVLDLAGGLIATPLMYLILKTNVEATEHIEGWFQYMVYAFIVAWIVQFIGHGFFEKRAPALLDNLVQALVLAPFFVLLEGLFLIGWRRDLKVRIDAVAAVNIAEWKAKKT